MGTFFMIWDAFRARARYHTSHFTSCQDVESNQLAMTCSRPAIAWLVKLAACLIIHAASALLAAVCLCVCVCVWWASCRKSDCSSFQLYIGIYCFQQLCDNYQAVIPIFFGGLHVANRFHSREGMRLFFNCHQLCCTLGGFLMRLCSTTVHPVLLPKHHNHRDQKNDEWWL